MIQYNMPEEGASSCVLITFTAQLVGTLGLSLICSKFYLLFLPEFPKILTHYSYFMPTSSPIIPTYSCNFYCTSDNNTQQLLYW